ncbi:DUF4157 domain-containing protein [Streptomyces sp. NPDC015125]|uniref:eCIS core domain-containing protein n=1 Tax=Streptomyces sp. NPDC015125 TaxID=3364938 RepID=UPI0036F739FB
MRAEDRQPGSGSGRAGTPRAARTSPSPAFDAARLAAAGKAGRLAPEAAAALQRAVGNAVFSAALASQEQHRHGPACGHTAPPPVQRSTVQGVLRTPGRPLDDPVRTDMESRLGADFSDVRVHTDTAAHESAEAVNAHAYTSGSHLVFQRGRYDASSAAGRHMLAHELTHVIQQRSGPVAGTDRGDGTKVSDPSDRFEREAEAKAHRALADPGPVQRTTGTAPTPGHGNPDGRPVQRTFHLGNKAVKVADDVLPLAELIKRGKRRHDQWDEKFKERVREEIVSMAEADQDFGRKTYEQLLDTAQIRIQKASAAHLPPVVPTAIKTGSGSPDPHDMEVELPEATQRRRLAEVRRRLSLRGTEQNLDAFRNRQKMVNPFRHKPTGNSYSISHTGNFVLGGPQEGEYEALFERARNASGLSDKELAKHFIRALTESGYNFDGMSEDGRKYCAKVVAIIQGAEFRRAAANPTVAIAAFNQVVTGAAGTLHEALNTYAVFAKAKGNSATGGSKESQFHRDTDVDQDDEDFKRRAVNEYQALAQLVSANGFNPNDEEEFYAGCDKIAATSMGSFASTFEYAMP